jgi:hypothetical protein
MLNAEQLADKYGEVCKKTTAAKILGCCPNTVNAMLRDGRLEAACGGAKVDVRSIARFIAEPAVVNEEARIRKIKQRRNMEFAV